MKIALKNLSDFMSGRGNLLITTFISKIIVLSMVIITTLISSEIHVQCICTFSEVGLGNSKSKFPYQ